MHIFTLKCASSFKKVEFFKKDKCKMYWMGKCRKAALFKMTPIAKAVSIKFATVVIPHLFYNNSVV